MVVQPNPLSPAGNLALCLRRHASARPFLYLAEGTLSYEEAWRDACAYAAAYRRAGVAPGALVAIVLRTGRALVGAYLGALLHGSVPTCMPYPSPKQDRDYYWRTHLALFARIAVRLVVTWAENAREFTSEGGSIAVLEVDQAPPPGEAEGWAGLAAGPSDLALLQHSSGTTGLKKGVALSHGAIIRQAESYAATIGLGAGDTLASWLPLYHDMGLLTGLLIPLVTGAAVAMLDPFEWVARPTSLLDAIVRHRAAFVWLPNFAFQHIALHARDGQHWDLAGVRGWYDCSEPCKPETFAAFLARFAACGVREASLGVCYAMAEAVFAVTQTPPGQGARTLSLDRDALRAGRVAPGDGVRLLSCGVPVGEVRLRIVDAERRTLPVGSVGEIAIAGGTLFDGYHRDPALTARKLDDGWYHSGDLGFIDGGELFVTGRLDDLIIVYGRNLYAHDIEQCLTGLPGLAPGRAVAFGMANPRSGTQELVVLAEAGGENGGADDAGALRRAIQRRVLDATGVAAGRVAVVPRGWLVKTTSGKLSRTRNLAKYQAMIHEGA